jgi:hypothetical protein
LQTLPCAQLCGAGVGFGVGEGVLAALCIRTLRLQAYTLKRLPLVTSACPPLTNK